MADWMSTSVILDLLQNPMYTHIHHFVYVETDQWPVQPFGKLEPIFEEAGLLGPGSKKVMAVIGEYPCDNVRDGGQFNMGTYLFVRHERMLNIFRKWFNSLAHNPHDVTTYPYNKHQLSVKAASPTWPGRQGAFSDGLIFAENQDVIHRFASANPLGSPFGTMVAHLTGGFLEETYDPDLAR